MSRGYNSTSQLTKTLVIKKKQSKEQRGSGWFCIAVEYYKKLGINLTSQLERVSFKNEKAELARKLNSTETSNCEI